MASLIARGLVEKLKELIFDSFFKFIYVKENKKTVSCKDNIILKESIKLPFSGIFIGLACRS